MSLRILAVHNAYQQRGGEDSVFEAEVALLRKNGEQVLTYQRHNDELKQIGKWAAAMDTLWSRRTVDEVGALIEEHRPDVIHCHNTFPLISPSIYWVASRHRVPVVQTLHNFRLTCVQAMLLRDGKVCEQCLGASPWQGVRHACYRGSRTQSAVLASMLTAHRWLRTYSEKIACFIALNDFCREKFIEAGLPREKIVVKPNFVEVPDVPEQARSGGLYVGRLSEEKGIAVLADAMRILDGKVQIDVVGTGPEERLLKGVPGVNLVGWASGEQVLERMRKAQFLVMPSIWYENFPRTLVEAFACRLPVIVSRIGALADLVEDGVTGVAFSPGDSTALSSAIMTMHSSAETCAKMGRAGRVRFEEAFTAEANCTMLVEIYRKLVV